MNKMYADNFFVLILLTNKQFRHQTDIVYDLMNLDRHILQTLANGWRNLKKCLAREKTYIFDRDEVRKRQVKRGGGCGSGRGDKSV